MLQLRNKNRRPFLAGPGMPPGRSRWLRRQLRPSASSGRSPQGGRGWHPPKLNCRIPLNFQRSAASILRYERHSMKTRLTMALVMGLAAALVQADDKDILKDSRAKASYGIGANLG